MLNISLIVLIVSFSSIQTWEPSKCTSISKPEKKEACTIVYPIGINNDYRCCFVSFKRLAKETKAETFCKVYPYDADKLGTIKRTTYANVKDLDIQCSGQYLFAGLLISITLLLF